MNIHPLLAEALDAHGGLERWRRFGLLSATIVTGGEFWAMKGVVQDSDPRHSTVDLRREWASLSPYGEPDWTSVFTPRRIAIEDSSGSVIAERLDPRAAFAGHQIATPWDPLHRAYFSGYALWTYFNAPFVLANPDVEIAVIAGMQAMGEAWRGLRAAFPERIATHSRIQDFYFGPDGLLRRHDYHVDVAGRFAAVHLVSDFVDVEGMRLPARRRAYRRNADLSPHLDTPMVSIDLSDFVFT